jgi:23S rRNA (guanine2445-N2)-methyltransferase / 23S rRNA (guanine2069-N7)-methyltransferase
MTQHAAAFQGNRPSAAPLRLFATAPRGLSSLLAEELRTLGCEEIREFPGGVGFRGTLRDAYRVCLWSRVASRVLLQLVRVPAPDADILYQGVRSVAWEDHLSASGSLAVDFNGRNACIAHSHYGALKVKDAVVDQLRGPGGQRPSVVLEQPDIRINVHLRGDEAAVSLDLSGEGLHRRGYRGQGVEAPLKENLAAAILLRAGWPEIAREGRPLIEPMCGSGTLPIEAALIAADIAPGLLRAHFGFLRWGQHQAKLWEDLLAEARERARTGRQRMPAIFGYDAEPRAIRAAAANVERAGLRGLIHLERRALADCEPPGSGRAGLLVANPPYGERLGAAPQLMALYTSLGEILKQRFVGWRAAVLTGNAKLGHHLGLRAKRIHTLYNGAIECRLLRFEIGPEPLRDALPEPSRGTLHGPDEGGAGGEMFANRLRKNLRELGRWARREGIDCYRLYDADMPEYALAVDLYHGDRRWAHVQEYHAPPTVDPARAAERLRQALAALPLVLEVPAEQVFFKVRRRQKGRSQYERQGHQGAFHEVREGAYRFLVNFTDYLDTGLFLDHRLTRRLIGELASGRHFLNLFGYTGTATVYAAGGGALSTTTVDLSNTYLDWAQRNLSLNGLAGPSHRLVRADCLRWLARAAEERRSRYGLIFLDPPTFSASKGMTHTLDVQRDHADILRQVAALLEPEGILMFSNNRQRFRMDAAALADLRVEDITRSTISRDFARNPRIHNCWKITRS